MRNELSVLEMEEVEDVEEKWRKFRSEVLESVNKVHGARECTHEEEGDRWDESVRISIKEKVWPMEGNKMYVGRQAEL